MRQSTLLILCLGIYLALAQKNGFCNLVWNDEFDGTTLSSRWQKEQTCYGGGNNELQCYTPRDKNIYLENGNLVLKAYKEGYTGSQQGCTDTQGCTWSKGFTSGRINSRPGGSWTYGRFETRAQLASGSHLWPAIWMMPMDYSYGGWAASGEIDIMEQRGNQPGVISGTLHHGGAWPRNVWTSSGDKTINQDLSTSFHVYALEWTPNYMKWYLDDYNFYTLDLNRWWNTSANGSPYSARGQPWDRRFHFILNLAVGGGYFGGYPALTDAAQAAWVNPTMKVDYVRVWQQGGNCNGNQVPTSNPTPTSNNNQVPSSSAANDGGNRPVTCNGQNYDSKSYTCTINDKGNQVLCPTGTASCGQACFSTSLYCCENSGLKAFGTCAKVTVTKTSTSTSSTRSSTSTTATPTTATPTSSTTRSTSTTTSTPATSSSGIKTCNGQTYGSGYVCNNNDQGTPLLCPSSSPSGCGQACYNSALYCCKNSSLRPTGTC